MGGGGGWHWGDEEGVADARVADALAEGGPVPAWGGFDAPHVELEGSAGSGGAGERLVGTVLEGELGGGLEGGVVDGFEDVPVDFAGALAVKGDAHEDKGVCEPLDADADGAVAEV